MFFFLLCVLGLGEGFDWVVGLFDGGFDCIGVGVVGDGYGLFVQVYFYIGIGIDLLYCMCDG